MTIENDYLNSLDKLALLEHMYEQLRLVDPLSKRVTEYHHSQSMTGETACFDFWGKNKICDNCISVRAYLENQSFVKIEYNDDRMFMVTAIPFEKNGERIVAELLKDVTRSMVMDSGHQNQKTEIRAMIDFMNGLALKDPLTGVFNRRYIDERFPADLAGSLLADQELSIIMADIDYFKTVNDTYGHLGGDAVLKGFADTLGGCIRKDKDWISRYGGEEFLICLPGADLARAVEAAERIRAEVEAKHFDFGGKTIRITASFGVCAAKPFKGSKVEDYIQCADEKLYAAKRHGRNRCEC